MEIRTTEEIIGWIEFGEPDKPDKRWVAIDDILNLDEREYNLQLLKKELQKSKTK